MSLPREKREVNFHFRTTEEEAALIRDRMERMGVASVGAYLRKMSIDGYFVTLDLTPVQELVSLLRRCSNNLNQYAKRANESGNIYAADIEDLQERLDQIWDAANAIMTSLAGIR